MGGNEGERPDGIRNNNCVVNLLYVALRFLNDFCGGSRDKSLGEIIVSHREIMSEACAVEALYKENIHNFIDSVSRNQGLVP